MVFMLQIVNWFYASYLIDSANKNCFENQGLNSKIIFVIHPSQFVQFNAEITTNN